MRPATNISPCLRLVWLAASVLVTMAVPAVAGAPFATDDADTPEHFEIDLAAQYTRVKGEASGVLPSLEVNYAAAPNVQLHALVSLGFSHEPGGGMRWGYGDTEFGLKWRFIDPDDKGLRPAVAVFPLVELPTGDESRGFGTGHMQVFLPIWLSKERGAWTLFGGGGYWINPGRDNRNWWFAGVGVLRHVTSSLGLGVEVFHTTADEAGGQDSTGFNFGGIYDFSETHHLLVSAGRGLQHADVSNQFSTYVAYQITF